MIVCAICKHVLLNACIHSNHVLFASLYMAYMLVVPLNYVGLGMLFMIPSRCHIVLRANILDCYVMHA
jgi:hypothetical protein